MSILLWVCLDLPQRYVGEDGTEDIEWKTETGVYNEDREDPHHHAGYGHSVCRLRRQLVWGTC